MSSQKSDQSSFINSMSSYCIILEDICQEEKATIAWLSNSYLGIIEKNGRVGRVMGHKFDLNPAVASLTADDKYATFDVLRTHGIPVAEHALIYEFRNHADFAEGCNSLDYAEQYLCNHDNHIVIKPNNGSLGAKVFQVKTVSELEPALARVFYQATSASMCPYYEIQHEYRIIVLDGEARLIYGKTRGDDWRFNLCRGAQSFKVEDSGLRNELEQTALAAAKAIGLRFCSVDIINTIDGEYLVLEVNSGVMIEKYLQQHPEDYALVKEIYRDAVRKMLNI